MQIQSEADYKTIEYEIARLYRQIILHLAKRFKYQELARKVNANNNYHSVANFRAMLYFIRQWTTSIGLNPNIVNKLSKHLIEYYLTERRNL